MIAAGYIQCHGFLPCLDDVGTADTAMHSCSCTSEIGITVGAVIVVVCLIAIVITVIVVLCLRRYINDISPCSQLSSCLYLQEENIRIL